MIAYQDTLLEVLMYVVGVEYMCFGPFELDEILPLMLYTHQLAQLACVKPALHIKSAEIGASRFA